MTVPAAIARDARWVPGLARPSLARGDVHVWRADLRTVDDAMLRWLSAGEHERRERILNARKAHLWARSRGVLRELLGRYTGRAPDRIAFRLDPRGRPSLDAEPGGGQLYFNLSHAGWLALFAFGCEGPVGVDVEQGHRGGGEFLHRWTRAEAVGKCLGTGVGIEAASMQPARLATRAAAVWVSDLNAGDEAVGAIASSPAPEALHAFQLSG